MRADQLEAYLAGLKQQQRYRSRLLVDGPQGIEICIEGNSYLNFCSNDYLGLAAHPEVVDALQQGANRYGVGSGASHLINGHSRAHHALEEELAAFVQRPRALLFSTGYMANLGVMSALLEKGDQVWADRLNHASLLDGGLLSQARLQRYPHNDSAALDAKLQHSHARTKLVASDGVFSMDGDLANLSALARVCTQHQAWLMIDDAHGLGVVGQTGRGVVEVCQLSHQQVPILVGTLGKAFGTFGAFVAGSEVLIETLIQRARSYIYTTALPPAVAEATRTSLRLVIQESWRREKLQTNIALFRRIAIAAELPLLPSNTPIQPIVLGDVARVMAVSAALRERGILLSAIRPPTVPEGSARLRVTLCAHHESEHIERLVGELSMLGLNI
ncbi:MAG: 8-amino-7-oxononanoate synthase [Gammaproteobacteria bacterium]|nr:8-amino-7-oxononanoate synthase [Gammaproteobacteria bacterium]